LRNEDLLDTASPDNALLIGTGAKNKFCMSEPADDAQFANYVLDPLLARVINAVYGSTDYTGPFPRTL